MRIFLSAFLVLLFSEVVGQETKSDSILVKSANTDQIKRTDSFVFVSRTFPIPRDCNNKDESNCCAYWSNPDQVSCGNGTGMTWDFFPTEEIAKQNADNWASKRDRKSVHKKEITCYVLGKEVKGWQTNVVNRDGLAFTAMYIWATVDGRAVLITLSSQKELKQNKDIPQVYKQILRLKS
jgi:hypothetical protein